MTLAEREPFRTGAGGPRLSARLSESTLWEAGGEPAAIQLPDTLYYQLPLVNHSLSGQFSQCCGVPRLRNGHQQNWQHLSPERCLFNQDTLSCRWSQQCWCTGSRPSAAGRAHHPAGWGAKGTAFLGIDLPPRGTPLRAVSCPSPLLLKTYPRKVIRVKTETYAQRC